MVLTLVRDGVIGMERAFDVVARHPAKLLGVGAGELREGAEADIALINPTRSWVVDSGRMAATAGNTPFDRQPVEGRVTALWKGGVRVAS
jgi:dihydroorotase